MSVVTLAGGERIDVEAAARRIHGAVRRTPLASYPSPDERVELRLKLECLQETNSFKARGAWNQLSRLTSDERARGVVATSSGNHGRAVAWAARRAGVRAAIYMAASAYPNKVEACRAEGAEVVLTPTRVEAEERCAEAVRKGAVMIHPYKDARTIEGAGTVGLEIAEEWPAVEVVLVPVGGGGLIAGSALALASKLGDEVAVIGVEPEGSPNLSRALEAGRPVSIDPIRTRIQGLCPLDTGELNLALAQRHVEGMIVLTDDEIVAGQRELVRAGHTVEPAGAAAFAALLARALPAELLEGRSPARPLRVACVVSGGNAEPEELAALRR
jgi:threonine dehydratase